MILYNHVFFYFPITDGVKDVLIISDMIHSGLHVIESIVACMYFNSLFSYQLCQRMKLIKI
jgi:hypothetical protein